MDLELEPTKAYAYTINELEKNLALAEVHAKQYGADPLFCADCLRKHFILIEGLAEENINFTDDPIEKKFFSKVAEVMRVFKEKVPELDDKKAMVMAEAVRKIRKALVAPSLVKEVAITTHNPSAKKDLNNPNHNLITENRGSNMEQKELVTVVGSQLLGRGLQEAVASVDRPVYQTITLSNVVGIGGGLAGCLLTLFNKIPKALELPTAVVSSKLLADELVKVAMQYMPTGRVVTRGVPATTMAPVRIAVAPTVFPSTPSVGLVQVD